MKTMRSVCLLAGVLTLASGSQSPAPVTGVWDGNLEGARAVTLTVRDGGRTLEGNAIFYILKDEGSGFHTGAPSPEIPLQDLRWDGRVLRFVVPATSRRPLSFEMRPTGRRTARLKRLGTGDSRELTITLWRQ